MIVKKGGICLHQLSLTMSQFYKDISKVNPPDSINYPQKNGGQRLDTGPRNIRTISYLIGLLIKPNIADS